MAHITFTVQVDVADANVDTEWHIVDMPTAHTETAAQGHVNWNDGDRELMRVLGTYVIKKRTGLSAARLKEYYMGVREEAAESALIVTTPTRHRTRRTFKDFVAVAVKIMLYKEAMARWSHLMNWCKLVRKDADPPAPSHGTHKPAR